MLRKFSRRLPGEQRVSSLRQGIDIGGWSQIVVRCVKPCSIELTCLDQWIVFRRRIDVGADTSNYSFSRVQTGNPKVRNLDDLPVSCEQQILRFDIAVNHAALV